MLEEGLWSPFGAYEKVLQPGLNAGTILFLDDCAQFRMNEEAKVTFPLSKHKQDNWPESRRRASPALLPVFHDTELDLWTYV